MSNSGISFTGIQSGVDTASIVEQLMAIEARPKVLLQQQQALVEFRKKFFSDISAKLISLRGLSDGLRNSSVYAGSPFAGSSDPKLLTAGAGADAAAGTYEIAIGQLARANVLQTTATTDISEFGQAAYAGAGIYASGSTLLTALTDAAGTSLGYAAGGTVTLSATKDGAPVNATFNVTATSTLEDLRNFMQTNMPGANVTLEQGGKLKVVSPPGVEQAYTSISLSGGLGSAAQTQAATGSTKVASSGYYDIVSGGVAIRIDVTAGQSMADVAKAINDKNGSVVASTTNGLLRITARQTGSASSISITPGGGAASLGLGEIVAAQNAEVTVNGVTFSSATNSGVTHGSMPGVTLSLLGTTPDDKPLSLTVDPARVDKEGIKTKIKAFVTGYNELLTMLNDKLSEDKVKEPQNDADRQKGALRGDSTLQAIVAGLRGAMRDPVTGTASGKNISGYVGISTGAIGTGYTKEAVSGKLTLDESKLDAALEGGTDALEALFASDGTTAAGDGLMQRISDLAAAWNQTPDGVLKSRIEGATARSKDLADRILQMNERLAKREERLKAQFTAMETALAQLKSMQADFSKLPSWDSGS